MFVCKSIQAEHKDLIHDVSYDFHGGRMATCSSDQTVKVWDKGDDGTWNLTATWKAHSGSVWRVVWAHPEFGQVLATCSFDRTAAIWEELVCETGVDGIKSQWVKKSSLVDSRTSVTDIKFAPKHLGLQLATCSSDGMVRIYEAPDMMNLSQWSLQNDFSCKLSCSCLDWNPSRLHAPMIAIGSDDANPSAGGKVHLYEYSDSSRKWTRIQTITSVTDIVHDLAFSPNLGRSCHILAIASKDLKVISLKPVRYDKGLSNRSGSEFEVRLVGQFNDHDSQVWRLAWNVIGTILASAGDDGRVRLWKANYLGSWKCISVLSGDANSGPSESGPHKHDYGASGGTNSMHMPVPGLLENKQATMQAPYLSLDRVLVQPNEYQKKLQMAISEHKEGPGETLLLTIPPPKDVPDTDAAEIL